MNRYSFGLIVTSLFSAVALAQATPDWADSYLQENQAREYAKTHTAGSQRPLEVRMTIDPKMDEHVLIANLYNAELAKADSPLNRELDDVQTGLKGVGGTVVRSPITPYDVLLNSIYSNTEKGTSTTDDLEIPIRYNGGGYVLTRTFIGVRTV